MNKSLCLLLVSVLFVSACQFNLREKPNRNSAEETATASSASLVRTEGQYTIFTVDGKERTTIIQGNSTQPENGAPVIFVFHGHGGSADKASNGYQLEKYWSDALIVYMQGEPGVSGVNDPLGQRNGWQKDPGELDDRDVKFFDAVFAYLQQTYQVDPERIYIFGHSNGARFCNVLWNMRGDHIAAISSAAAQGGDLIPNSLPRSIFILIGENDPVSPYENQAPSIQLARTLLGTDEGTAVTNGYMTTETSPAGLELVTYIHPDGHEFPPEVLPLVIEFFNRNTRP